MRLSLATAVGLSLAVMLSPAYSADTCGDFGTSVYFEDTPKEAAAKAAKAEKLVLVLHVSGHFEDPNLT